MGKADFLKLDQVLLNIDVVLLFLFDLFFLTVGLLGLLATEKNVLTKSHWVAFI